MPETTIRRDDLNFWLQTTGRELAIGLEVKVDQSNKGASDWVSEWDGLTLIVTGIVLDPATGKANISVVDGSDVTDGFTVHDLLPA